MIVVVEGPSAAGKSTWVARWDPSTMVPEHGAITAPTGLDDTELARFWSDLNAGRWRSAVDTEHRSGLAICDTDPLKLHYDYCLARMGLCSWQRFDAGVEFAEHALARHTLGIADVVLCALPDDATLERQRAADSGRRRGSFELHRQFGPLLRDWYGALDALDPGRVQWAFPETVPERPASERYDTDLFGTWMQSLPRLVGA